MVVIIPFGVLGDECAPLIELKTLIRSGRTPRLVSLYGELPGGDCSAICRALMLDFAEAEPLNHRWRVAVADLSAYRRAFLDRS